MSRCVASATLVFERRRIVAKISVGGQALIEGVLMRGPSGIALCIRKEDGELFCEEQVVNASPTGIWKLPILRGIFALGQSMKIGLGALNRSSEFFGAGEVSRWDAWLEKRFGEKLATKISMALTLMTSVLLAVVFFIALPTLLVGTLQRWIQVPIVLSLLEGLVKMGLFFAYVLSIRRIPEIHRVFQYHGAEHKAVYNFESGKPLSVENARGFSTLHPRCGTSYVFFVLTLSILFFSFVSWTSPLLRTALKIVFLPVVAGLGFELLRFTAKEKPWIRYLRAPGMMLQKITTAEPDDQQLEVAIEALKRVIPGES